MHKMVSRGILDLQTTSKADVETSRRMRGLQATMIYSTPSLSEPWLYTLLAHSRLKCECSAHVTRRSWLDDATCTVYASPETHGNDAKLSAGWVLSPLKD